MLWKPLQKKGVRNAVFKILTIKKKYFREETYLVRSNPRSSSASAALGGASWVSSRPDLVGLGTGDLLVAGGGLLLAGRLSRVLEGLASNCAGFSGVLPMSAYFQNGAGELVGICWLGRWAVLGGASFGWTRRGAGVTNELASSWR